MDVLRVGGGKIRVNVRADGGAAQSHEVAEGETVGIRFD